MSEFIFRDAVLADLPRIVEIYNTTIASRMVTADLDPVSIESREKWFAEHNPNKRPLWVFESKNEIIGWISYQSFYGRPAYDSTVEISIYLDPNVRGKGIGKIALEFAISKAPSYGIKTLLGFIFSHNEPSLKLFKYFGFEEWANLPNIATLDENERGLMILGKRVSN